MNEHMIDLYKQACEFAYKVCKEENRVGGPGDHIWQTLSTGRFAELIVRECADIAKHHVMNISTYADADFVDEQIKEHFGVKE